MQIESLFQNLLNHHSVDSGVQTTVGNENILTVFDDTARKFNRAQFANLATPGKRNKSTLFSQNITLPTRKVLCDCGQNTTHLLILESLRVGKQLKTLSSELEFADAKVLQHSSEKATTGPYSHLLIDLSPTSHDALRFSGRICALDDNLKNFLLKEKAIGPKNTSFLQKEIQKTVDR